jgi:hypothetical protein
VYKVINLFRNKNLKVALRVTNTIFQQLSQKPKNNDPPGIYRINCNTCKNRQEGELTPDVENT